MGAMAAPGPLQKDGRGREVRVSDPSYSLYIDDAFVSSVSEAEVGTPGGWRRKARATARLAAAAAGPDDPEITPRTRALTARHAAAQLEYARNAFVLGKRSGLSYEECLRKWLPGDHSNEFISQCRRNERWHAIWDEVRGEEQLGFRYTDETNNIRCSRFEADDWNDNDRLSATPSGTSSAAAAAVVVTTTTTSSSSSSATRNNSSGSISSGGSTGSRDAVAMPPPLPPWRVQISRRWDLPYLYNPVTKQSRWLLLEPGLAQAIVQPDGAALQAANSCSPTEGGKQEDNGGGSIADEEQWRLSDGALAATAPPRRRRRSESIRRNGGTAGTLCCCAVPAAVPASLPSS